MKKFSEIWQFAKKHILTAISYMIPLVVAAGLCMALGQVIDGDVRNHTEGLGWILYQMGNTGMGYVVPVICAGVAYSLQGKPGIAPGLIVGWVCTNIKAGFIGGIVAGFLIGWIISLIKKYIKLPKSMQGLMPVMVIPVLSTAIAGILMYFVIGKPFAALVEALTTWLTTMQTGSKIIFGAVVGAMACFDFGGPVNKTASAFVNGLLADGIYGPESIKFLGSMVPPFGIAIACLLAPKKFTKAEKEALKAAVPMGVCMITEGVIPVAARDLVRVVVSCCIGSAVGGALCMVWGTASPVTHGGLLTVPLFEHPLLFCAALAIGSVITGVILAIIKKEVTAEDEAFDGMDNAALDMINGTSVSDGDVEFTVEQH